MKSAAVEVIHSVLKYNKGQDEVMFLASNCDVCRGRDDSSAEEG